MNIVLRPGTPNDAEPCGAICYRAFKAIAAQHNFPPDFPEPEIAVGLLSMLLGRDDVYAVVAEADGRIAGSNFMSESSSIAGIGPITVDPDLQNGAIGRRLMDAVLTRAAREGFPGVRLVQSAYHNRSLSLYTKLGFDAREPLSNLQGPPIRKEISGHPVRPATRADVDACNALCSSVHGHDRGGELRQALEQGSAAVVERGARITGYTTGIGFIGHAVATTNDDLKALIAAAPAFLGPGFLLPTRNGELFRWCLSQGLRVVQPMTLMSLGLYGEPRGACLPSILY